LTNIFHRHQRRLPRLRRGNSTSGKSCAGNDVQCVDQTAAISVGNADRTRLRMVDDLPGEHSVGIGRAAADLLALVKHRMLKVGLICHIAANFNGNDSGAGDLSVEAALDVLHLHELPSHRFIRLRQAFAVTWQYLPRRNLHVLVHTIADRVAAQRKETWPVGCIMNRSWDLFVSISWRGVGPTIRTNAAVELFEIRSDVVDSFSYLKDVLAEVHATRIRDRRSRELVDCKDGNQECKVTQHKPGALKRYRSTNTVDKALDTTDEHMEAALVWV
ncbi:hypothetical protein KCV00_g15, partial [Aureobasidium melanogenum]